MPRPILPPTPQSSVDLPPKLAPSLSSLELAFTLPPPALGSIASSQNSASTTSKQSKDVSQISPPPPSSSPACIPASPTSPVGEEGKTPNPTPQQSKKRRRAPTLEGPKPQPSPKQKPTATETITLPPPPTRNRKIIQMKPRQPPISPTSSSTQQSSTPEPKSKAKKGGVGSKADKPSDDGKPTTAVGRKIARKTAHSLIERRRRFKMNEEFGVLKGMIPACAGVEMHKLAILQASIEYLRYLEQCVTDLKASNSAATHKNQVPTLPPGGYDDEDDDGDDDEDEGNDEEMIDPEPAHEQRHEEQPIDESASEGTSNLVQTEVQSTAHSTYYPSSRLASPYLDSTKSQYSPAQYSPTSSTPQAASTNTSPNLYPQLLPTATLPNLYPEKYPSVEHRHDQVDTEATQALLLLADGSRRSSEVARGISLEKKGRGMSVKDLLSS